MAKTEKSLLGQFISFVRRPDYGIAQSRGSIREKARDVFRLWALTIVVSFIAMLLVSAISNATGAPVGENRLIGLAEEVPIYMFLFVAFIWSPVVEELTFRMGMRFSRAAHSYSAGLMLTMAVFLAFEIVGVSAGLIAYAAMAVLFGTLFWLASKTMLGEKRLAAFYAKRFGRIFYFFTAMFAAYHLFNYANIGGVLFLAPLLVLPQFMGGLFLGFVRMRYGLKWSALGHLMHNIAVMSPSAIILYLPAATREALEAGGAYAMANITAADAIMLSVAMLMFLTVQVLALWGFHSLWSEFVRARKGASKTKHKGA
ncbi:MAG: hypothetical protein V1676_03960 [Candidatus Diapherotrites archaeon]